MESGSGASRRIRGRRQESGPDRALIGQPVGGSFPRHPAPTALRPPGFAPWPSALLTKQHDGA
jgi:hypothetical protein